MPSAATLPYATFDFKDGHGPVPAHNHPNGGGWVADTADVSGDARVYGDAWVPLSQTDHGYSVTANWVGEEWRIVAGCRNFTIAEARAHWGSPDYHTPRSGSRIVHMLDWLEKQPEPSKDEEGGAR